MGEIRLITQGSARARYSEDIFYNGLTIESRTYLDSCDGSVFRKRTVAEAEELMAKIAKNHDEWSIPEPP